MVSDYFGYGLSAIAAFAAVFFGTKSARLNENSESNRKIGEAEKDRDNEKSKVQMYRRRELTHERIQGILKDELMEHNIPIPPLPDMPEDWTK